MRGRIIQRPAGQSDPAVIIRKGIPPMALYLYTTAPGGHFAFDAVDKRKPLPAEPEQPTIAEPVEGETEEQTAQRGLDYDAALAAWQTAHDAWQVKADADKPFRFAPLAENGTDRVKVTRHNISAETFAAWMAEADGEKRAALLTDGTEQASNISPTASQLRAMRALVDRTALAAMLAAGALVVPSDRAEKAAGTASGKRAQTEAERTDAALDALFGPAPEPEPEPEQPASGKPSKA